MTSFNVITDYRRVKDAILRSSNIAIASHINPDGDSIGSLLALGLGIEKLGKKVHLISSDGVPKRYRSLPGASRIKNKINEQPDLAIAVDCSNKEILGKTYGRSFRSAKEVLEIDHHEFRRPFGTIALIDKKSAAVGELIYQLLKKLRVGITKDIAHNLLTSIIVETNSFRLPTVKPLTFEICTDLIKKNVDFHKLAETVYWSRTRQSVILSGICMKRCKFLKNGSLAWSIIRKKDFEMVDGSDEDVDTVADEIRSIQEVEIAILFREKNKKHLRVSLRSKGRLNIASIAEKYGGGGHFDIAGCYIPNNIKYIKDVISMARHILG
ncbi:MAG: bifunctional oligoribonuclease/PAP phosphatase NrnA [Candidatus Omnitrophota bacterium]|jgi:phosphoesterase RecJ-like protein|nr:MAG: bifunctional oligoribonuclease/PAP phosphatase NrnA [Candidatus Omnitrophota bacterium]